SKRTAEEDPGAPFFNDTRKYVVSSTLTTATWRNSEIVGGYDPKRIQQLREESAKGLYVSGSGTLVRALIADGLVDELHLFVYPVAQGDGPKLFTAPSRWTAIAHDAYDNGVIYAAYRSSSTSSR